MLARGWLAYPVTPMHAHLPPKSGCRNILPRFALSRRRATALFRNPVCKAQRSVILLDTNLCVPEVRHFPTFGGCLTHRPPPIGLRIPIVRHHHRIAPTAQYTAIGEKTAEERFNMLARGWLAYPVTPMHTQLPPKSGCRNILPRFVILVLFDYFRNKMFYELHRCIIPHRFFDKRPRSHSRQRASR